MRSVKAFEQTWNKCDLNRLLRCLPSAQQPVAVANIGRCQLVKAMVVNPKQVDVTASRSRSFRLSWNVLIAHCTGPRGALSETVTTVSLSTVPRLSHAVPAVLSFGSGEADAARMRVGGVGTRSTTRRAFTRPCCVHTGSNDWIKWCGIYMTRCSADVMGIFDFFEETEPRKTAENTPMQCWFGGSQPRRWRWKFITQSLVILCFSFFYTLFHLNLFLIDIVWYRACTVTVGCFFL